MPCSLNMSTGVGSIKIVSGVRGPTCQLWVLTKVCVSCSVPITVLWSVSPYPGVSSRSVQSEALSLRGVAESVKHSIFIVLILLLDIVHFHNLLLQLHMYVTWT